jgi:glycine cleavage system H protein
MDGFTYTNIFETKGIEYLIVIAFMIIIIPFWTMINRKTERKPSSILSKDALRIPAGIFLNKNHTWAYLTKSGIAKTGLDDFLFRITGEVNFTILKDKNESIRKGDVMAEINHNGKFLRITSPLTGIIVEANTLLKTDAGDVADDPYGLGWIYKIRPVSWIDEISSSYLAEEAIEWTKREIVRFKEFLTGYLSKITPENSLMVLQDGGELINRPLTELPDEIWQDFQKSFLI